MTASQEFASQSETFWPEIGRDRRCMCISKVQIAIACFERHASGDCFVVAGEGLHGDGVDMVFPFPVEVLEAAPAIGPNYNIVVNKVRSAKWLAYTRATKGEF